MALLLSTTLRYVQDPNMPDMTQLAQDSILFGGEYVMLGNTMDNIQSDLLDQEAADQSASPEEGEDPDIEADDMEDAGEVTHKTPPLVTQKTESPHKVKESHRRSSPRNLALPRKTTSRSRSPKPRTRTPRLRKPSPKTPTSRRLPPATPPTTG